MVYIGIDRGHCDPHLPPTCHFTTKLSHIDTMDIETQYILDMPTFLSSLPYIFHDADIGLPVIK